MVDEPRSFDPDTAAANQTRQQGGGVGQREMDAQRDPDRAADPTTPQPPAPAGEDDGATAGRDRGRFPERNAAGIAPDMPYDLYSLTTNAAAATTKLPAYTAGEHPPMPQPTHYASQRGPLSMDRNRMDEAAV